MSRKAFRPTNTRLVNSMKVVTGNRTNATIRDLEEEEGELQELIGTVESIDRDKINGSGWKVKTDDGQTYLCSVASSLYEIPSTVERGGMLYPNETVTCKFTVNPVLRINTITEFLTDAGDENSEDGTKNTTALDVSKWTHGNKATTVIAKPKSALSISDGFIELNYDNDNSVLADPDAVRTIGRETQINTDKLSINSDSINIQGTNLSDLLNATANANNKYNTFELDGLNGAIVDNINNMSQLTIPDGINQSMVIGELKDQQSIPLRPQTQQLITDGNCVDQLIIDENGIISIEFETDVNGKKKCPEEKTISNTYNWITPQNVLRNYIKVIIKETCDSCNEWEDTSMEFINYCPSCNNWNTLVDTSTSIKCTTCNTTYCQNCGIGLSNSVYKLNEYKDNYIIGYGTTCKYCKTQLDSGTTKYYVNYCQNCKKWGFLYATERFEDNEIINVLKCQNCDSEFCCTCGIDQEKHGLTLSDNPVQYTAYKNALRKLKYIRDGN